MAAHVIAPFQYPGGKHRSASTVWSAIGDVRRYVEPFAGSLGVLLARPGDPHATPSAFGTRRTVSDREALTPTGWGPSSV